MEIIFYGRHDGAQASESLVSIIEMLNKKYHIDGFREMHLSVTLIDESGADVELIDSETQEAFRIFEVYRQTKEVQRRFGRPTLKLVVDKGD